MSLFRSLIVEGLAENLTKNETKVFIALMGQTIGYGEASDHLTNKRLSKISGVHLDRFYDVVAKGLFEVEESDYYDYRYTIAKKLLNENPRFFTPHLPKNGTSIPKLEIVSKIQSDPPKNRGIHNITFTSFYLTLYNQQQPSPSPQVEKSTSVEKSTAVEQPIPIEKSTAVEQPIPVEKSTPVQPTPVKKNVVVDLPKSLETKHQRACVKRSMAYRLNNKNEYCKHLRSKKNPRLFTIPWVYGLC